MFNFLRKDIITKEEQSLLLNWVYDNECKFIINPNGSNRKFYSYSFDFSPQTPILLYKIKQRIIKKEKIKKYLEEPRFGDYVGWITDGGFINRHKDKNFGDLNHVRYNLFLSVPHRGGDPIYNNWKITPKERKYYKCNSGNEFHSCKRVIGSKPRIVISYGFLVP